MPSQFFGLNIAYTGLLASNAALNTTSNNIANVQTEGYSRQQVKQQAANALRVFQTYGCAGAGVETLAIERVRDEFYDGRFWDNNAKLGEYSQKQYYMEQIEAYFDDNGKNAGFKTVFDQLMITGLEELLKNPDDSAAKSQLVGYAGALAEYFNGVAGNLEKLQKDVNQEIKLKVDELNSLAGEIATLNKQINTIELTGVKANELRDRRALLIDQLSEIVDVEVKEVPIADANDPERETGANRLMIRIAGGQILVDDSEYNRLECVARRSYEKVNQTDIDGLYDVYWEDGQKFNLYSGAMGGALKGLVQMRDGNNGENFTGLVSRTGYADGHDTVTIEVGRAYLQDLNKCNLSDSGGIINLGNQIFYYDSWSYNVSFDDEGNEVHSYTFTLSDQEKNPRRLTNDRVGKTASIGNSITYQGIPYYMSQMNEWVRTFAQKFNDIVTAGVDSNGDQGLKMFSGNLAAKDAQFGFPDDTRYDQYLEKVDELKYAALADQLEKLKKEYHDQNDPLLPDKIKDQTDKNVQAMVDAREKANLQNMIAELKQKYINGTPPMTADKAQEEAEKAVDKAKAKADAQASITAQDREDAKVAAERSVKAADEEAALAYAKAKLDPAEVAAAEAEAKKQVSVTVKVGDDSYYRLTAMNFDILVAVELDPSRIANRYDEGDGVEQNDLLEDLKDLATNKERMSFRGCSASEFLQCVLSDVALNAQRANTFYQNFKDISGTIDTQRISISGVDEDEEALNLVKYQNGYNLASKMIQTLTEIYDRLILETGV